MDTQTQTLSDTTTLHSPQDARKELEGFLRIPLSRDVMPEATESLSVPAMKSVLDEFVRLVKDNPKVWAVYASQEGSVIHVWTYVDSTNRRDRSPVYSAEWKLLTRYPQIAFDFNVPLVPVDGEQFEVDEAAYLYKR